LQTFLGFLSLQAGTELISLALLFNKLTGLYGLLAILTGYSLSLLQLSMYTYSVFVFGVLALCLPHIRKQTPLQNLVLAWLYIVDTAVNSAYTAAFAALWFMATKADDARDKADNKEWMGVHETAASMTLIVAFTAIRVYFSLVVMAHTSQVLQNSAPVDETNADGMMGAELFAPGTPAGEGWRGKMGRSLVYVGRNYWPGQRADEEWTHDVRSKLRSRGSTISGSAGRASVEQL